MMLFLLGFFITVSYLLVCCTKQFGFELQYCCDYNMKSYTRIFDYSDKLLSYDTRVKIEKLSLTIAICCFFIHIFLIILAFFGLISVKSSFLLNPIAAIYTPFSFILVYEVYLLIFYIPHSITIYIGKQFEIITLIVIRRIFKDIASLDFTSDWFHSKGDLQFTYDIVTTLILLLLIFLFYKNSHAYSKAGYKVSGTKLEHNLHLFIRLKLVLARILVPTMFILAFLAFFNWSTNALNAYSQKMEVFVELNNIFFDEFFTALIIVDALLLLMSLYFTDKFHVIVRNSGFVISTILLKLSFSTDGIMNNVLIIGSVLFGLFILLIHNLYDTKLESKQLQE